MARVRFPEALQPPLDAHADGLMHHVDAKRAPKAREAAPRAAWMCRGCWWCAPESPSKVVRWAVARTERAL